MEEVRLVPEALVSALFERSAWLRMSGALRKTVASAMEASGAIHMTSAK